MASTKRKAGRNAASKSGRKKASEPRNNTSSSPDTVKDGTGLDAKQQSALERGGSLAQRNDSEDRLGPGPDAPTEITSAAPPNKKDQDEAGRASSPSFDEKAVTGKGRTGSKAGPKASDQEVKPGEGESSEDEVPDIKALEDLPPGSSIDIRPNEVVIHAAIAGGSRKSFSGRDAESALKAFNDFAENGPRLFEGAAPGSADPESHQNALDQFDKEALERSKKDLEARGIEAD